MQWENVSDEQLINEVRKRGYSIKDAAITMTRDDIIRMAKEAGFEADGFGFGIWDSAEFNRFAAFVAAAEREACAEIAEKQRPTLRITMTSHPSESGYMATGIADEIRARGEL